MTKIGYKKLRKDRIAKLLIQGISNEDRSGIEVDNRTYASYRCSKVKVLDIYDMLDEKMKFDSGESIMYPRFVYRKGETLTIGNYDENLELVEATGIHYYLSEECARYSYLLLTMDYVGTWKSWSDNGELMWHVEYYQNKENIQKKRVIDRQNKEFYDRF